MENDELLFDNDSFLDEIKSASEAKACYDYFTSNLTAYRHQLAEHGLSYEDVQKQVRQCWKNLLKSSQSVGYTNSHLERMAKQFAEKGNEAKK